MPIPATFAELQAGGGVMLCLARHRDRPEYSRAKLEEVGFRNIQLVDGFDGHMGDWRAAAAADGWKMNPNITPGRAGAAISVFRLWQRILDEDLPYLLIFEDDVLPHPLLAHVGPAYWHDTPPETDWVLMGNQLTVPPSARHASVLVTPAFCNHAYVVTHRGASRALATMRRRVARGGTVDVADIEVHDWMAAGTLSYVCWNGTNLPKAFPTSEEVGTDPRDWPPDIAWAARDTGVFYQNFALGSMVHGPEIHYG